MPSIQSRPANQAFPSPGADFCAIPIRSVGRWNGVLWRHDAPTAGWAFYSNDKSVCDEKGVGDILTGVFARAAGQDFCKMDWDWVEQFDHSCPLPQHLLDLQHQQALEDEAAAHSSLVKGLLGVLYFVLALFALLMVPGCVFGPRLVREEEERKRKEAEKQEGGDLGGSSQPLDVSPDEYVETASCQGNEWDGEDAKPYDHVDESLECQK